MSQFQPSDVCSLLENCPDKAASELAKDTALVKSLTKVFNVRLELEIAKDRPRDGASLALTLVKKGHAVSGVAATATGSSGLTMANFAGTQTLKTIGLMKLAGMTPPKASIYLTLTMTEKIVSAAGLGGFDKCNVAIASLSATSGMGAMACFASGPFTLGIGCVVGVIAVAADAFDAYGQCSAKWSTPVVESGVPAARLP